MTAQNKVSFLATGSEIITGEIVNTNSQQMAQILFEHGILCGDHLIVDDELANLSTGLKFLADRHRIVITTGGLGPTTDDRTRDVITAYFNQTLHFNEDSWNRIVKRLTERKRHIAESNRQQAFFPEQASIIPNLNGTADAFYVQHEQQIIIALPGQ